MNFVRKAKRILSAVISAAIIFAVLTVTSTAASNVQTIYDFLITKMGLNSAAACGVLANIEYESDFNNHLWGDNGTSYGICQWHNERLTNMKNYCAKNGLDWTSLEGQLYFLKYELTYYKGDTGYILDKLQDITNNSTGAYNAGYRWCYYFERPANVDYQADRRGSAAMNSYWPVYGNKPASNSVSLGDVDKNGKINSSDALMIVEKSVGSISLNSDQTKAADINHDGSVTSTDALIVLNCSAGADNIRNYQ